MNHFIVSQVNPHVVPFLPKEDGPRNEAAEETSVLPRWVSTMTHLAKDEVLHRMTVLSELGIFPTSLTKVASIVNQKYIGNINIYPELMSSNFPRLLENPTTEFMLQACLSGERATWPRLSRIRNHCAIELALDRAIQQMRARVAFSPSQVDLRISSSTHPWIHSSDRGMGRARIRNRRGSSNSQELEKTRRRRCQSRNRRTDGLRKSRSTVTFANLFPNESAFVPTWSKIHRRRSSMSSGGGIFAVGSDSDDDELEHSWSGFTRLPAHRASWDAASHGGLYFGKGPRSPALHSPVRSRQSSFSTGLSPNSATNAMPRSPKQNHAPSKEEIAMTKAPSSRHLLSMTPTSHPSSPVKPRH